MIVRALVEIKTEESATREVILARIIRAVTSLFFVTDYVRIIDLAINREE